MTCQCVTFETIEAIRFCEEHHKYFYGARELASVSKVIRTLLPTDYSMVPPDVLETSRIRGQAVDFYFSEYLRTGTVTVNSGERSDVVDRLSRLIDWWEKKQLRLCDVQQILFREEDEVAGTYDIATEEMILDLKNVSTLQPAYKLQLGAYADLDIRARDIGIIHVTKDAVKLVKYDRIKSMHQWRACLDWFNAMKELQ